MSGPDGSTSDRVVYLEHPITVCYDLIWDCDNRGNEAPQEYKYAKEQTTELSQSSLQENLRKVDQKIDSHMKQGGGFTIKVFKMELDESIQSQVSRYAELLTKHQTEQHVIIKEMLSLTLTVAPKCHQKFYRMFLETPSGIMNTGALIQIAGNNTIQPLRKNITFQVTIHEQPIPTTQPQPVHDILDISVQDMVEQCYINFLRRASDAPGKQGWVDQLKRVGKVKDIIPGFLNSDEFHNQWSGHTARDKVTFLYHILLNREPDEQGLNGWITVPDWNSIIRGFLDSHEYNTNMGCGNNMLWKTCDKPNTLRVRWA